MKKIKFSDINILDIKEIVQLKEKGVEPFFWNNLIDVYGKPLTETEQFRIKMIQDDLMNYSIILMNEATIWARAIYPILVMSEYMPIQAWAEIYLKAQYPQFEVHGIVDGVLGNAVSGIVETPFLTILEVKRGVEAKNPQAQLYGQLLATAFLNYHADTKPDNTPNNQQEVFACYTVSDSWTFVHGVVDDLNSDKPRLIVQYSREYSGKLEIETILQILKSIIQKQAAWIHAIKS
ncbi:MAG: hypothetical protein AAF639_03390 [Chloroflexota bacterium]